MEEMRNACRILESPKERDLLGDLGINGRIIINWILKNSKWTGFSWLCSDARVCKNLQYYNKELN
jgi:hypothetical protein